MLPIHVKISTLQSNVLAYEFLWYIKSLIRVEKDRIRTNKKIGSGSDPREKKNDEMKKNEKNCPLNKNNKTDADAKLLKMCALFWFI